MKKIYRFPFQKFSFYVLRHFHQKLDSLWAVGLSLGWWCKVDSLVGKAGHTTWIFKGCILEDLNSSFLKWLERVWFRYTHHCLSYTLGWCPICLGTTGVSTSIPLHISWLLGLGSLSSYPDGPGEGSQGELDSPGKMTPCGASSTLLWELDPTAALVPGQRTEALHGWFLWGKGCQEHWCCSTHSRRPGLLKALLTATNTWGIRQNWETTSLSASFFPLAGDTCGKPWWRVLYRSSSSSS